MTESQIQKKIVKHFENEGYFVLRLAVMTVAGLPDLLALKPSRVVFIEVKKSGGILSKLQEFKIKQLRKIGFKVMVLTMVNGEITYFS